MKDNYFRDFLVKAKKTTYAGDGKTQKRQDGCNELIFVKDNLFYRDRYFGSNPFIGEEVVFLKNNPLWVMNYCGRSLSKLKSKMVYGFLKKALLMVDEDLPFRGPQEFVEGDWRYINQVKGDLRFFNGVEEILHNGKRVYVCNYHGGFL